MGHYLHGSYEVAEERDWVGENRDGSLNESHDDDNLHVPEDFLVFLGRGLQEFLGSCLSKVNEEELDVYGVCIVGDAR